MKVWVVKIIKKEYKNIDMENPPFKVGGIFAELSDALEVSKILKEELDCFTSVFSQEIK